MSPGDQQPSWRIRRRIINATLLLCGAQLVYLTVWGQDTRLNETLALGAYALAGAVIGAYVFGAAWQDIRIKQADTYAAYGPYPAASTPYDDRPR